MWYAIYTKPAQEDVVTLRLRNIDMDVLNPKLKTRKFKRDKLAEVIEPLFPCYIFADFDKEKYAHLITYTRGVRYIVGKKEPIRIYDEVIEAIRSNIEEGDLVCIKPQHLEKGDRVLIKEGPFRNFYGIFEREIKGPERVMILLETIHCRVELDSGYLDKL